MKRKYGILYCLWNDENVIKFSEIIKARNLKEAIEKTDRNIEWNVVIPLTESNEKHLRNLLSK